MIKAKFTLSKSIIIEKFNEVKEMTDIISYSSKTNPIVTPILEKNSNCLFSVHMKEELVNITNKSRILFLAQGWSLKEIKHLINQNIFKFAVDNEADLNTLLAFLKENDNKIELMLRIKLKENSIKTEKYFVFGIPSDRVNKIIRELKGHENIPSLGVHFHRKTQNMAEWNLKYEVSNMIDEDVLEIIDVLNIGGGLPSEYANTNIDVIESIKRKIKDLKIFLNEKNVNLMIEPGRFISAPAGKLITTIRTIYDNNIIVNASVYNTDMDALIVPVKLLVENESTKKKGTPFVIKVCTPCSLDLFRYKVYLTNPKIGDKLIFLNAGAYNFSSDFCNLEKIETEIIK